MLTFIACHTVSTSKVVAGEIRSRNCMESHETYEF